MTELQSNETMKTKSFLCRLAVGGLFILQLAFGFFPATAWGADEPSVIDRSKAAVNHATESVQDAGRAVGNSFENLWQRVDESRLVNRTRDEVVAWAIMGVLVGAVAGMLTSLKPSGLGKLGRLLLGLAGAFLGGMIVHVGRIDFGLGPVLIRYEELLFSLAGAVVLIIAARLLHSVAKKKTD